MNTLRDQLRASFDPFPLSSGSLSSSIMIVGESWGTEERLASKPFVGTSGQEFTRILNEAGLDRNLCHITNVFNAQPQNNEAWRFFLRRDDPNITHELNGLHPSPFAVAQLRVLYEQIHIGRPKIIIAVGNYALWALTQHSGHATAMDKNQRSTNVREPTGILKWRGSQTWFKPHREIWKTLNPHNPSFALGVHQVIPVLPIVHPAAIQRQWSLRAITVHDLRERVPKALLGTAHWEAPPRDFLIPIAQADFPRVINYLGAILNRLAQTSMGPLRLAADIETLCPMLVCLGFALSPSNAISIPFVRIDPGRSKSEVQFESFWTPAQERELIKRIRLILSHPNVELVGQYFLYDTQYLEEEFGIIPRLAYDTMLAHHLIFPGTPKGLDYLSSLYCEHHLYWKEDGKDWHIRDDLESQLRYNALDCAKTIEIANTLSEVISAQNLEPQWEETMQRWHLAARMTRRGIRRDEAEVKRQLIQVMTQINALESWLLARFPQEVAGSDSKTKWCHSAQQKIAFLYSKEMLGLNPFLDRKTGRPSSGKEALEELRHRYPRLTPLFDALQALASLSVFRNNFLLKSCDLDGRFRCTYNPAGTETFRFNSTENAFGRGTNLQNIPSGNEDE